MAKRRRRRWWELDDATKQYVEKMIEKFEKLPAHVQLEILKLPKNFTCFHFKKKMSKQEAILLTLPLAIARPKGALEYVILEIDRIILRKAKRIKYAFQKTPR